MDQLGAASYLGVFAGSVLLSLVLMPQALRLATRFDVFDHPGGYKRQASPVPYLGGVAMVAAFSAVVLGAAALRPPVSGLAELAVILGAAVVLSLVGLVDDLRGLGLWVRVVVMVAAALALYAAGVQVQLTGVVAVDATLTVIWLVGITNAFNLLDNMDGLSAGVASVAAGFFFLIAAINGQFLVAALSLALAGVALGFLRHNVHPARIYMGDAGSLFLGLVLAVLGVKLRFDAPSQITVLVPVLVLGVAIFDTTLVTLGRVLNRRNPFTGGADHTSHRLVAMGLPVPVAVGLVYAAAVALGWLAVVTAQLSSTLNAYLLFGFTVAVGIAAAVVLAMVPVYGPRRRRELRIKLERAGALPDDDVEESLISLDGSSPLPEGRGRERSG